MPKTAKKRHNSQAYGWRLGKSKDWGKQYRIPVYEFSTDTYAPTEIKIIDKTGKTRTFSITLNDEKGVVNCEAK
jgi:hypothetical protein